MSSSEKPERTTQELAESASRTRRSVARDVERLAGALTPTRLKDRALEHAEHSVERWSARTLLRLKTSPRWLASYVRRHPLVGAAVLAGTAAVVWRLSVGRRR